MFLYSDYLIEDEPADRYAKLKLHIKEVVDTLSNFASKSTADGWNYTRQELQDYIKELKVELKELQSSLGLGIRKSGMFLNVRIN